MKEKADITKYFIKSLSEEDSYSLLRQVNADSKLQKEFNKLKNTLALLSSKKRMPIYEIENYYIDFLKRRDKKGFIGFSLPIFKYVAIFIFILGVVGVFKYFNTKQIQDNYKLQTTTIIADYGQMSKVILPDSSIVWLNSGTSVSYNNSFSINNRELQLKGEAFFDIKHNSNIPLIVSCNSIKVRVLGTKFNVSNYSENNKIRVVLEKGRVELLDSNSKPLNCILKPGQIATYFKSTKSIKIKRTAIENWTTWRKGNIVFSDTPMYEVISTIERKFDVRIKVSDKKVYNSIFNANFNDESLSEILDYIEYSCPIKYKSTTEGNKKLITFSNK
jgi:ferric-dicitrate binding protein FerR (iron transport regulator)